ncbi:MAG: FxLYD domain-containing protein [Thermoleophilia bacterium]|nr:FxLYD domain-containing protein [Thermoleophilia bacterium]
MRLSRALTLLSLPVALPLALAARPAHAQDAPTCPVDVYQPAALTQAGLTVQKAAAATNPADVAKNLKDAMKYLQDEKRIASNPIGAGYLKAQIYVLWLHQEGVGDMMTNEELNAKGPKTDKVDLVPAIDSLLKVVEAMGPACVEETREWRQSKPWIERINKAYAFLSADDLDSASYFAERATMLFPTSPFVHNIHAQLANKRGDKPGMMKNLRLAIEAAKADTSLGETRRQMQFQLATTLHEWAATGGSADKDALDKESLALFSALLREEPMGGDAAYAFSSASEIISVAQDSAAAQSLLAPMVTDPEPYGDLTLLLGADLARIFGRSDDAMELYAAALRKNPNTRDASYFLSFMYYEAKQAAPMMLLTQKLLEIDPSNPDNYLMRAYAIKLTADEEKDAAKKAALMKQMNEFTQIEATMPHKLLVQRFERRAEGALLVGTVENRGKVAKAYTVKVDFLDITGNVLETMTAEVPSVKPGETGTFRMTPVKPGIVAYKYDALK